ncbi:MAG: hypothetical protein L3J74_01800 [Bacteroidales bacterium]|nr:hypothetical protein [Bacteroidales bacterium]
MRKIFILLLLFFNFSLKSQVDFFGGRAIGVSNASLTYQDNWAQLNNQAGLSSLEDITVSVGFTNSYFIKELGTNTIAMGLPTKSGVFGLNYTYFGYSKFNQNKIGLAYAMQLGKRISAGMQINYLYTHIEGEYGASGVAYGEIGLLTQPIDNFFIAAHISNFWRSKYTDYTDIYIPMIFRVGAGYLLYEKALLSVEFEKDIEQDLIFKSGLEFDLDKQFFFRFGMATNPMIFSFGFGYQIKTFKADIAFSKHPVLGYSPAISLNYAFKKSKNK